MLLFEISVTLGLLLGVIYALAGVGLVVIYRTSGYISFAQGDIAAFSLYIALMAYTAGAPYPIVVLVVIAVGALLGGGIWGIVIRQVERFGHLSAAMATLGVGLILQGVSTSIFGGEPWAFPSAGTSVLMSLGGVAIRTADVIAAVVSLVAFAALAAGFQWTRMGLAIRAANDNPEAAVHIGIAASRLRLVSWVVSGALAALVGVFIAPTFSLTPTSINGILVFGFLTVVLGGFESVLGALVAGIMLGVSSNLVAAYVHPQLVTAAAYVVLLLLLLLRPHGLFGRVPLERV